jgi:hypothetical protein
VGNQKNAPLLRCPLPFDEALKRALVVKPPDDRKKKWKPIQTAAKRPKN